MTSWTPAEQHDMTEDPKTFETTCRVNPVFAASCQADWQWDGIRLPIGWCGVVPVWAPRTCWCSLTGRSCLRPTSPRWWSPPGTWGTGCPSVAPPRTRCCCCNLETTTTTTTVNTTKQILMALLSFCSTFSHFLPSSDEEHWQTSFIHSAPTMTKRRMWRAAKHWCQKEKGEEKGVFVFVLCSSAWNKAQRPPRVEALAVPPACFPR